MVQIVAVNNLGYVLPLNFVRTITPRDNPRTKSKRGIFEWWCEAIYPITEEFLESQTYQLPMPEFGL